MYVVVCGRILADMALGSDENLTCPQAAAVFGVHVETVRRWIHRDPPLIGHVRIPGGAIRIPRSEVDRFLTLHGVQTAEDA